MVFCVISIVTDPSALCFATSSITILHQVCYNWNASLGSGSLCQLKEDLGCFNNILLLPNLNFFLVNCKLLQSMYFKFVLFLYIWTHLLACLFLLLSQFHLEKSNKCPFYYVLQLNYHLLEFY